MSNRDNNRNMIISAMIKQQSTDAIFEDVTNFKQKRNKLTDAFKKEIFKTLESHGFNLNNGNVQAAVSVFFSNLDNI